MIYDFYVVFFFYFCWRGVLGKGGVGIEHCGKVGTGKGETV